MFYFDRRHPIFLGIALQIGFDQISHWLVCHAYRCPWGARRHCSGCGSGRPGKALPSGARYRQTAAPRPNPPPMEAKNQDFARQLVAGCSHVRHSSVTGDHQLKMQLNCASTRISTRWHPPSLTNHWSILFVYMCHEHFVSWDTGCRDCVKAFGIFSQHANTRHGHFQNLGMVTATAFGASSSRLDQE